MKDCTKKMRRMAGGPSGALSDPFNSLAGGLGEEPNGRCYYCCGREKSDEPERQGQLTFRLGRRNAHGAGVGLEHACGCLIDGHHDLLETLDWKTSNVLPSRPSPGGTKCENARGTQLGYSVLRLTPPELAWP